MEPVVSVLIILLVWVVVVVFARYDPWMAYGWTALGGLALIACGVWLFEPPARLAVIVVGGLLFLMAVLSMVGRRLRTGSWDDYGRVGQRVSRLAEK